MVFNLNSIKPTPAIKWITHFASNYCKPTLVHFVAELTVCVCLCCCSAQLEAQVHVQGTVDKPPHPHYLVVLTQPTSSALSVLI